MDATIDNVLLNSWPIQLWRAEVIDPVTDDEQTDCSLNENAGYTRAVAVRLIEKLALARLFGNWGEKICRLLDSIADLSFAQIEGLAALDHSLSDTAYANAWYQWLSSQTSESSHRHRNHSTTLAIHVGNLKSPINEGFLLIHRLVWQRAQQLQGDRAFIEYEEDGETEIALSPCWNDALTTLLHIAMGLGASGCVEPDDRPVLLAGLSILGDSWAEA